MACHRLRAHRGRLHGQRMGMPRPARSLLVAQGFVKKVLDDRVVGFAVFGGTVLVDCRVALALLIESLPKIVVESRALGPELDGFAILLDRLVDFLQLIQAWV